MTEILLHRAIEHHKAGNLPAAEGIYRQILQQNPQNAEALHWLGAVAYQEGDGDRALAMVARAIELEPKNPVFYNTAGMAHRSQGNLAEALRYYRLALTVQPDNADIQANFHRAWWELRQVHGEAAMEELALMAAIYHDGGYVREAYSLYQQVLQDAPQHAEALHRLGTIAYQQGQFDRAIDLISQAIVLDPDNAFFHNNLGAAYQAAKQLEQASQSYRRALELMPGCEEILPSLNEVLLLLLRDRPEVGKRELFLVAGQFHFQGDLKQAENLYRQILQRDSNYAEALHGLGVLLNQQNQPNQAIAHLNHAITLNPKNYHYYNNLGLVYYDNSQFEAALQSYKQALALQPGHPDIKENLNQSIEALRQYYEEVSQIYFNAGNLEQAAQIDFQAGNFVKENRGNLEEARRYYQRAVEANPAHAEAHHALGEIYLARQQLDETIAACRQAIQQRSNYAFAYKTLGNALLAKGDREAALRSYAQAVTQDPNFAEAYSNAAGLYLLQGKVDRSIALYQKALSIDDKIPSIYWNFGKVLERQGKLAETIASWQKALELQPNFGGASAQYQLATKFLAANKRDEAIARFQKAIEMQPDFVEAHWDLCEVLTMYNQAAARWAAVRFYQQINDPKQVLAPMAMLKSHLNSGVSDVARKTFLEFEPKLYQYLSELSPRDVVRLYLNVVFDVPHLRDDIAANTQLCATLARQYVTLLDRKVKSENYQPPHFNLSQGRSPLRIGFISQHFRRHSVGWLSVKIVEELAKITPHIFLYITGEMNRDEITQRFEKASEKLYQPKAFLASQTTQEIIKDDLDILVDLDSVTVMQNTEILHRRPAPVCVSWLGFDAPYISEENYYLGDWYTHPQGVEPYYLEKLVRLPNTFAAISGLPIKAIDRAHIRKSLRIAPNQIVYLCVATGNKYCPEMVEAQIKILKQVPDSILLYKARVGDLEAIGQAYRSECARQGIGHHRVRMLPRTRTEEEHRLIYQFADILIDSYPYSGATHVVEALCFNMPVVAMVAQQSFGRQAYSLMRNAGTDMGIAWNWAEYLDWAVRLGKDGGLRQQMRSQLEQAKQPEHLAPLWNPQQFARDLYGIFKDLRVEKAMQGSF